MAIGDIFKLSVVNSFNGDIINTLHYKEVGVIVADNHAQTLGLDWATLVLPDYRTYLSDRITTTVIEVRGVLGSAAEWDEEVGLNGLAATGDLIPQWTGPVISWRTGVTGRSFRGRTYLPPCAEGDQDAGIMSGALITQVQGVADAMMQIFAPGPTDLRWQLCIFSTVEDGAPRVPPVGTNVTTRIVDATLGTQRRRRPGSGS